MRSKLIGALSTFATVSLPAWAQPAASTVLICKDPKDPTTCVPLGSDIIIIHPDWLVTVIAVVILIGAAAAIYAAVKIRTLSVRR